MMYNCYSKHITTSKKVQEHTKLFDKVISKAMSTRYQLQPSETLELVELFGNCIHDGKLYDGNFDMTYMEEVELALSRTGEAALLGMLPGEEKVFNGVNAKAKFYKKHPDFGIIGVTMPGGTTLSLD
jgi:hypothetical protein